MAQTFLGRWLHYIADLLSGRVANTLYNLQQFRKEVYTFMQEQERRLTHINEQLQAAVPAVQQLQSQLGQFRQTIDSLKAAASSTTPAPAEQVSSVDDELSALESTVSQITSALSAATAPPPSQGQGEQRTTAPIDPSVAGASGPGGSQADIVTGMPPAATTPPELTAPGIDAQPVGGTTATTGGTSTSESPGGSQTGTGTEGAGQGTGGGETVLDL